MSGLLDRLGSAFVAPRDVERAGGPSRAPALRTAATGCTSLGVLCRPQDAAPVGAAVALALAARERAPLALLALWGAPGQAPRGVPAARAAKRLAATLSTRGHAAAAAGRLVTARLAADLREAAPEAVRALAAAADVPSVVVLAGARDDAADPLLGDLDGVLVALPEEADDGVADLALAGLTSAALEAHLLPIPASPASTRALAAAGLALLPPLRAAAEAAVAR